MQQVRDWLNSNKSQFIQDLTELVKIPCISTDGEHQDEIAQCADLVCRQMMDAGLNNVQQITCGDSYPYCYGEWLNAPGKPTLFLYSHYDVQPINYPKDWKSEPFTLTPRDGRLYARGSADDKGAITAQLASLSAFLKTSGKLPVNVKMVVEGEEEIGSENLMQFFDEQRELIKSDVIVVTDTENLLTGLPSITYSLRGVMTIHVKVESAGIPAHSGMAGGVLADSALALNVLLSRLYWGNGQLPIPGYYDSVRAMTDEERDAVSKLPLELDEWSKNCEVLDGVQFATEEGVGPYEQTWRKPSITVIAQEASSIRSASNQVIPRAEALISCRLVPDQKPEEVLEQVRAFLTQDPPWGVKVTVEPHGAAVSPWMTEPNGPAFESAMQAMKDGYGTDAVGIGCGGTIGFVGPLAELFDGAPALLLGIEDPKTNAHAPNESLDEGDWTKLMASLAHLYDNLGKLTADKVK